MNKVLAIGQIMKFLKFFKRKKTEELTSENMVFRPGKHTNYGAKLKKNRLGQVQSLEIWNVSPWPDDKIFMLFEIFPTQATALKYFLKLFDKHVTYEDAHPVPISMLPKARWWTEADCYVRKINKMLKTEGK
ncbi:MAG: hypothetical protein IMZ64_05240 [Bacteroidetes bacterium]|nr:hypothetical protein [Bacteroidota bacterium]